MARKKPRQQVGEVRVTEGEEPRKPRRVTRLDFSIDYEPPTPDRVSLITTSEPERREGGGHLYDQAARWANDNPLIDSDRQAAFAALGMKLAMLTQFLLDTQVTPSEDGLYHLEVEIDPEDPTHYTVNFQYPVGTAAILGANATALAPGANPTASIDQNGILQLGIPAGSPGEDGAPGADGEDGQSVTSVTASTLSPGSSATADYDPQTGELLLGIPQGAQGVQGPPGQSTLITLPESTGEDDQDSCNVAGFLAEEVIQKVLTSIITSRQEAKNRNAQVADAVEALIGVRFGRNIPGFGAIVGLVGDGVRQFVDAVANSDLSSLIAARDDSSLWSDVACAVYCAITPNRGISAGNMQAVLDAVGGVVYTPNQGIITEFVNFMEALQLEGLQAISYSGIYAVYDCSGCECPDPAWCYEFDFSVDDGDWSGVMLSAFNPDGPWATHSTSGWNAVYGSDDTYANNRYAQAVLERTLNATLTGITVHYTLSVGNSLLVEGIPRIIISDNNGDFSTHTNLQDGSGSVSWAGARTLTNIRIWFWSGFRNDNTNLTSTATITKITLQGTGTNPFGEDNC